MTVEPEHNARSVFACCFMVLITLMGTSAVVAYLSRPSMRISADVTPVSSFRDKYPFDVVEAETKYSFHNLEHKMYFASKCYQSIAHYKSALELYSSSQTLFCYPFCRLKCAVDELFGNNIIEIGKSTLVRLPRGYIAYVDSSRDDMESWKRLKEFDSWLKERNIPLMKLLPAAKYDDMTFFPLGVPHEYSRMIEECKSFLAENKIPVLDATKVLLAKNADCYSWFYKTDHHWNVFAGRLIAEETAKRLNDEFNISADVQAVQESKFALVRYPERFKGSLAARFGAPPEEFQVYYQRQETIFHIEIPTIGVERTGGFNDTLILQQYLKTPHSYHAFLYGHHPLVMIENKECANTTRALVIKHSQANVICPYLACTVRYLDIIDPRYFDGNIKAFIKETKPQIVILCF